MTKTGSATCSLHGCRNSTRHSSGRCHHHRFVGASLRVHAGVPATPRPVTGVEQPVPSYADERQEWRLPSTRKLHRLDGPAVVQFHPDGLVEMENYFRHGKLHREDGPALVRYDDRGEIYAENYYLDGKKHRDGDLPAMIRYPGHVGAFGGTEIYFENDRTHRIDGPAEIKWTPDGEVGLAKFFYRGRQFDTSADLFAHIAKLGPKAVEKVFASSVRYAPFIAEGYEPKKIAEILAEGITTDDGLTEALNGSPVEWVRAWEEGRG